MIKGFLLSITVLAAALSISAGAHSQAAAPPQAQTSISGRTYVGSATCRDCHMDVYERWSKTRMANVVTDPKVKPQVVIPDFSKPEKKRFCVHGLLQV